VIVLQRQHAGDRFNHAASVFVKRAASFTGIATGNWRVAIRKLFLKAYMNCPQWMDA